MSSTLEKISKLQENADSYRDKQVRAAEEIVSSVDSLLSVSEPTRLEKRREAIPTKDVHEVRYFNNGFYRVPIDRGFLVYWEDAKKIWAVPDEFTLNFNFVYKEDLTIREFKGEEEFEEIITEWIRTVDFSKIYSPSCYILDNPVLEEYTPYYDKRYPLDTYGRATPKGCQVRKYSDRFLRDTALLDLESIYNNTSFKAAGKVLDKKLSFDEAIVVSDGRSLGNIISGTVVYIDSNSLITMSEATTPSDDNVAVILAELKGAMNALWICLAKKKKRIAYYYDNKSIIGSITNPKVKDLKEVKEFTNLLEELDRKLVEVNFIELHPKGATKAIEIDKGLNFFHNHCDSQCAEITSIYSKGYTRFVKDIQKSDVTGSSILAKKNEKASSYSKQSKTYNKNYNKGYKSKRY